MKLHFLIPLFVMSLLCQYLMLIFVLCALSSLNDLLIKETCVALY